MVLADGKKPAILLVDDDPVLREVLQRAVRRVVGETYEIVTSGRGSDALTRLEDQSVTLMITDYRLGGMNGIQLAAAVKEQSPRTVVVLIAGSASYELQEEARAVGVASCLAKPFTLESLRLLLQTVLNQPVDGRN